MSTIKKNFKTINKKIKPTYNKPERSSGTKTDGSQKIEVIQDALHDAILDNMGNIKESIKNILSNAVLNTVNQMVDSVLNDKTFNISEHLEQYKKKILIDIKEFSERTITEVLDIVTKSVDGILKNKYGKLGEIFGDSINQLIYKGIAYISKNIPGSKL